MEPLDINLCEYFTSYKITKQSWKKIKDELVIVIKRLHGLNIYHNAIVPENIMYSYKSEQFYLIDFKKSSNKSTNDDLAQLDLLFNINLLQ
jgi:serine/threonine protein kinase